MRRGVALLLLVPACRPPSSPQPAEAALVPAAPSASAQRAPEPLDVGKLVSGRGPLHLPPIRVAPTDDGRSVYLVAHGSEAAISGAWLVTIDERKRAIDAEVPVKGLPFASRLLSAEGEGAAVRLSLESVSHDGQPSGMRASFDVSLPEGQASSRAERDEAPAPPDDAAIELLRRAASSRERLVMAVGGRGVSAMTRFQGVYARRDAHAPSHEVARWSRLGKLVSAVEAAAQGMCTAGACTGPISGEAPGPQVLVGLEAGRPVLLGYSEASSLPVRPKGERAKVAARPPRDETRQLARQLVDGEITVQAEAPLEGQAGVVALVWREAQGAPQPLLLVGERAGARLFELTTFEMYGGMTGQRPALDVRFGDLDGDGRTDAVVRATAQVGPGQPLSLAYLTPGTLLSPDDDYASPFRYLDADMATRAFLLPSTSTDDALARALQVPSRGISTGDLCALIGKVSSPAGLRRVAEPDAPVLTFTEPWQPTLNPKIERDATVLKGFTDELGKRCDRFVCAPDRPVCTLKSEPYSEHLWLTFRDGRPRVAAAAFYTGS